MESETMNSDHLQKILAEHSTGPKIKPGTHSVTEDTPPIVTDRSEENDNEAPPLDSADGA
jgi:hypothetical protein